MRVRTYLFGLPLLAVSLAAAADIYRCTGTHGEPSFSHTPCANGTRVTQLHSPPTTTRGSGLRPDERAWLQARAREKRRVQHKARPRGGATASRRDTDRQAYRCLRKRRALDAVKANLRRGYKPAQGEKLRRRRRAHEDYLDEFCS
jgi:hypothetical protein